MDVRSDYQGEINKFLQYGKKKRDPLDLGPDPTSLTEVAGNVLFGRSDNWEDYRAGNNADRESAKEREIPEPPPTESPVAPVDAAPEGKTATLNTSLWEKASKSPDGFSMFGNSESEQQTSPMDKTSFKREAEEGVREHERTLSSTDDPFISKRAEINKKYRLDELYRDVTDHKKNFWHSTPKDQVVFNQKLQKYQAALQAAEREDALFLSARGGGASAPRVFSTPTIYNPETGQNEIRTLYSDGRTESLGQTPTEETPSSRSGGGTPRYQANDAGIFGMIEGREFLPVADLSKGPLDTVGPKRPGEVHSPYMKVPDTKPARATPRPAAEPKPTVDPLDAEIAKVERKIIDAEAEVQTAKTRQDKDTAQRKLDTQNRVLETLRARKGGGQPGAAPPTAGGKPIAAGKTKAGNNYALVD